MGTSFARFCCVRSDSLSCDKIIYPPARIRVQMSQNYSFVNKPVVAECVRPGTNEIGGFPIYEFSVPELDNVSITRSAFLYLRDSDDVDISHIEINVTRLYLEAPGVMIRSDNDTGIDFYNIASEWHRVLFDNYGGVRFLDSNEVMDQNNEMFQLCVELRFSGDDVFIRNVKIHHHLLYNIIGYVK